MNISLIGMPGSGKTTIANSLLDILSQYSLIDTDKEIVKKEKKSINDIFAQNGEEYFRKTETTVLENILGKDNQIISTGGGIVKSAYNLKILKEKSVVFYLKTSLNELYNRTKNNKERPLLNVQDVKNKLEKLLNERGIKYEQAHYIINTDNKTPEQISEEITGIINEYGKS